MIRTVRRVAESCGMGRDPVVVEAARSAVVTSVTHIFRAEAISRFI